MTDDGTPKLMGIPDDDPFVRLKRIAELVPRWEKRAESAADGFGSSGGIGSAVYRECATDLMRVLTKCPHPNAVKVHPAQGDYPTAIVAWCPDCGAVHWWDAKKHFHWRSPGEKA